MKLSIVPEPLSIKMREGTSSKDTKIKEVINFSMQAEEYRIDISEECIQLESGSESGLVFAKATLDQIILQYPEQLPCLTIKDNPAYEWRSFQIDCARHFIPVEELKKMISMSAHFKLNKFHWHFSDDQGWRIECNKYPLLHEIGAMRKGDHFGQYHSDEVETAYYTRTEVKEIVAFSKSLGVDVVPEVDMPGHVTAILAAYPNLSCFGNQVEVGSSAGIYKDIFCPGKEESFSFMEGLLEDLMELFPGKYFHIGGDETPKERWKSCPSCQKRMFEEGLSTVQQLQGYFENRAIAFLKSKGRTAIVWNEAANGGNLDPDSVIQLWTDDKDQVVKKHLENGGKVIVSPMMNSYCDYPYGFISLNSMYDLKPLPAELSGAKEESFIGIECLVWTEFIRDSNKLEEMCWPRFAASAEVGWCGSRKPGYEDFRERMEIIYPVFEQHGIKATSSEGWVPSEEETGKQIAAFKMNFSVAAMQEFKEAQQHI